MGLIWRYFSAIASRLIFVLHSIYSLRETLNRIYVNDEEKTNSAFWTLTIILGTIVIEGAYTLIIRKGNEYKFFWPSGFIYVVIMIAITCILESFLMDEEIKCFQSAQVVNGTNMETVKLCELASLKRKDDQKLRAAVEIGMLGALVMGRWLLPRGELTRDQLSALLLNFIGNGADCIEFLNTWNDFPVLRNEDVTNTVLVLYSFSMLQFAVITTKTTDEYHERDYSNNQPVDYNENVQTDIPIYLRKLIKNKRANKTAYTKSFSHQSSLTKSDQRHLERYRARTPTQVSSVFLENADHKYLFKANKRPSEPVARYLQSLAKFGKWDEFSKALKQAQNQGFSKSSYDRNVESTEVAETETETEQTPGINLFGKLKYNLKFDQDVFQAVILMVSLEIPYLLARIVFAVVYNVSSTTMVFYTTKNIVMVVFLMYRLWVISSGRGAEEENKMENNERDPMNIK